METEQATASRDMTLSVMKQQPTDQHVEKTPVDDETEDDVVDDDSNRDDQDYQEDYEEDYEEDYDSCADDNYCIKCKSYCSGWWEGYCDDCVKIFAVENGMSIDAFRGWLIEYKLDIPNRCNYNIYQ